MKSCSCVRSHNNNTLAWRALLVYTGGEATRSEETIRPRTHANSLRIPVHAAQSPQAGLSCAKGETRVLPSLGALRLGVTSRYVSSGAGDHAYSSTDPTSRGDG